MHKRDACATNKDSKAGLVSPVYPSWVLSSRLRSLQVAPGDVIIQGVEKLLEKLRGIVISAPSGREGMQETVSLLRSEVPHYSWVGIYLLDGEKLHLAAWDGPEATEHTCIDVGSGICGLAARTKETVIVDDVNARTEYLACFPSTKSEIVVPLMRGDVCLGEIDIDSDVPGAFTEADRAFLESAAAILVEGFYADPAGDDS